MFKWLFNENDSASELVYLALKKSKPEVLDIFLKLKILVNLFKLLKQFRNIKDLSALNYQSWL